MPRTKKEEKQQGSSTPPTDSLPERIKAFATLLGAVIGPGGCLGLITAIIAWYNAGLWPFAPTPTPTPVPSFTPTLVWTATFAPTDTPAPTLAAVQVETSTPTSVPLPSPAPTITLSAACLWRPYSSLDTSLSVGEKCLNDLLPWGISGSDPVQFYRERGMNIGVFGISRKWENPNELNVNVQIRVLRNIRFLVLLSRQERGYAHSVGFLLVREGNVREIRLVTYDPKGYNESVSTLKELEMWEGNLNLRLEIRGAQARAYVNGAYFGQSQIAFTERFLFLGYQVMSGGESKPYIDVQVDLP
ncbi:MAG: hypothetical protein N2117_15755 [Anaerolineales bacterium]|nr:hypothetical protein [Anaerolineales bacterium]MCX7756682.1 hypothetical protein [Anaerolineales bacterium]MDW8279261.1 hypothetical protein [Anaerolineales bacterium]